jgi:hypothetical protein
VALPNTLFAEVDDAAAAAGRNADIARTAGALAIGGGRQLSPIGHFEGAPAAVLVRLSPSFVPFAQRQLLALSHTSAPHRHPDRCHQCGVRSEQILRCRFAAGARVTAHTIDAMVVRALGVDGGIFVDNSDAVLALVASAVWARRVIDAAASLTERRHRRSPGEVADVALTVIGVHALPTDPQPTVSAAAVVSDSPCRDRSWLARGRRRSLCRRKRRLFFRARVPVA